MSIRSTKAPAKSTKNAKKAATITATTPRPKRVAINRAKTLTAAQFKEALKEAKNSTAPERNEVALRLSFQAGLRAREIAGLRWEVNVLGSDGKVGKNLHITHDIGKRSVEREIPIAAELRAALIRLLAVTSNQTEVIYRLDNEPGPVKPNTLVKWFERFYDAAGFVGCSSHTGRRTMITIAAQIANQHGNSLRDVQQLAGHTRLETTASYIEPSDQQRALVANLFAEA